MPFEDVLRENGWIDENPGSWTFIKGNWIVVFDNGAWMEVGTRRSPRIFDVPVPAPNLARWTMNLIVHLCETDDRLYEGKRDRSGDGE